MSCSNGAHDLNQNGFCFGYQTPATSDYILPYPTGESYTIIQGNCTGSSHSRSSRYSYDFGMSIGDTIIAARAGTVVIVVQDGPNFGNITNYISIQHSDGTIASYAHINQNSVVVSVGDVVVQGATIATAGASGTRGAHLHFSVFDNAAFPESIPITFNNTQAHDHGLVSGETYTAL